MRRDLCMVNKRGASHGLTLVELAVVLAVVVIVAMAAVPYGQAWIANAKIAKANSDLQLAYRKAVAYALRNPNGVNSTSASAVVASVVLQSGVIKVIDEAAHTIWQSNIASGISVSLNCSGKVELNNNGVPISPACAGYLISAQAGSAVDAVLQ